jgi:hypothetical protein
VLPVLALGQPRTKRVPQKRERRDLMITTPVVILAVKLFGNSFLGQSGQAEGAVGELVVEDLETYDGEDDVVDAIEVTAVPGSRDSPVLHVGDRLVDDETY